MEKFQKVLLIVVLFVVLALIILTWGSIGSAVLTLGLLLCLGFLALKWFLDTHDPGDYWMED